MSSYRKLKYKAEFALKWANGCMFYSQPLKKGTKAYIVEGKPVADPKRRYLFACHACGQERGWGEVGTERLTAGKR